MISKNLSLLFCLIMKVYRSITTLKLGSVWIQIIFDILCVDCNALIPICFVTENLRFQCHYQIIRTSLQIILHIFTELASPKFLCFFLKKNWLRFKTIDWHEFVLQTISFVGHMLIFSHHFLRTLYYCTMKNEKVSESVIWFVFLSSYPEITRLT